MDTISYSRNLAGSIAGHIKRSDTTKQKVAATAGIAWATFSRRLAHPETSYFTVTEIISICNALGLDFIDVLKQAEHTQPALAEREQES